VLRKVRSPETGENTDITIVSVICGIAKRRGGQYTKRLLPPFLIPFCRITREGVWAYLRRFPDGRIVYRIGSAMLAAQDMRTIRRHVAMGLAGVRQAALALATLLSEVPVYGSVPQRRLGQSEGAYLEELAEQAHRAGRRARGGSAARIGALLYIHLVGVFSRPCRPLVPALSSVLRAVVFHDTS